MVLGPQGKETYAQRRSLFLKRKAAVEREMEQLAKTLDMLCYKCWYYEQAIKDGSEDRIQEMLPEEIQKMYDHAHE